jgi:hypothetical protein
MSFRAMARGRSAPEKIPAMPSEPVQCEPDVRSKITHKDLDARTQMSLRSPAQAGY